MLAALMLLPTGVGAAEATGWAATGAATSGGGEGSSSGLGEGAAAGLVAPGDAATLWAASAAAPSA